jgi:hypothetical protein
MNATPPLEIYTLSGQCLDQRIADKRPLSCSSDIADKIGEELLREGAGVRFGGIAERPACLSLSMGSYKPSVFANLKRTRMG